MSEFTSDQVWDAHDVRRGLWVALTLDGEEITPRKHVPSPQYPRPVRFKGVAAADGLAVARRRDGPRLDHLANGRVASPHGGIDVELRWNPRP